MSYVEVNDFITGYVECAEWCTIDYPEDGSEPTGCIDARAERWSAEAMDEVRRECVEFIDANRADLKATGLPWDCLGHDFMLTRNHHGTGYWDRGLGAVGDRLTEAAHAYGETNYWVDAQGEVYA